MKKKSGLLVLIIAFLAGIAIISIFLNIRLIKTNNDLRVSLPYLLGGESPEYFDIIDDSGKNIKLQDLKDSRTLIYIFKQPCSVCNKNLQLWNRMAAILKNDCKVYGIVLGDMSDLTEISQRAKFSLFVPGDAERFKRSFRTKINISQTIILLDGKAYYVKLGELQADDFDMIVKSIKNMQ